MNSKIIRLNPKSRMPTFKALKLDFDKLEQTGYQLIRGYGVDLNKLENELSVLSNERLFSSKRIGGNCHRFRVLPHSLNLSEQANVGGYHTDFMFQPDPPSHIALLCLKTDPKYPFYGRNQIVNLKEFLNRVESIYGITKEYLEQLEIVYDFADKGLIKQPMLARTCNGTIFKFHESLMCKERCPPPLNGIPFSNAIQSVFNEISQDLCLNYGDLLIISNHHSLHRRSECSIKYSEDGKSFESRELATFRFYI